MKYDWNEKINSINCKKVTLQIHKKFPGLNVCCYVKVILIPNVQLYLMGTMRLNGLKDQKIICKIYHWS